VPFLINFNILANFKLYHFCPIYTFFHFWPISFLCQFWPILKFCVIIDQFHCFSKFNFGDILGQFYAILTAIEDLKFNENVNISRKKYIYHYFMLLKRRSWGAIIMRTEYLIHKTTVFLFKSILSTTSIPSSIENNFTIRPRIQPR